MADGPRACRGRGQGGKGLAPVGRTLCRRPGGGHEGLDPEAVKFIAEEDIVPTEHDDAIKQLLEEFVRPAVEQDGGAIDFKAFKDGTVYVHLRGACSGCPSSTQTLKGGIEQLLKSKIDDGGRSRRVGRLMAQLRASVRFRASISPRNVSNALRRLAADAGWPSSAEGNSKLK